MALSTSARPDPVFPDYLIVSARLDPLCSADHVTALAPELVLNRALDDWRESCLHEALGNFGAARLDLPPPELQQSASRRAASSVKRPER